MAKQALSAASPKINTEPINERDPASGLPPTGSRIDDLSGVPGLLPHWAGEIQKRKKEILEFAEVNFAKKATRIFGSGASASVSGAELLKIIDPNMKKNNSTKILSNHPTNCNERAYLVSYILKWSVKRGKELSFLQLRSLLIHAALANAFHEHSLQSLLALHQVYLAYIEQLLARSERAAQDARANNYVNRKEIYLNKNMVTVYKIFVQKRLSKLLPQIKGLHLDNRKIKKFDTSQKDAEEQKNQIFRSSYYAVCIMRCFPMLRAETEEIANLILKFDNAHPLGWFLKGHITAASGELKFDHDRAGYRAKSNQESMVIDIKASLEYYGKSISSMPENQYDGLNYNILAEYISFIVFVCRFIPAPRLWKASNLEKALNTLKNAQSNNLSKLLQMQATIESLLSET